MSILDLFPRPLLAPMRRGGIGNESPVDLQSTETIQYIQRIHFSPLLIMLAYRIVTIPQHFSLWHDIRHFRLESALAHTFQYSFILRSLPYSISFFIRHI